MNAAARATRAEIRLDVLGRNVELLGKMVGTAELWVVVKANAYGHGAVPCARAALAAGARGLCVALTQEAVELRDAGITAPLMVLSEQPVADVATLVHNDIVCVVYNTHYIDAVAAAADEQRKSTRVHLKIDTGMHRVGVSPDDAVAHARAIVATSHLVLDGVMTHLATADDPAHLATAQQVEIFQNVVQQIRSVAPTMQHVHFANSAATLRELATPSTTATASIVRVGIAAYGLQPGSGVASLMQGLQPVMSLRTRVMHVQRVSAGSGVSYGLRTMMDRDSNIATLPIGYADGIARRAWQTAARVLVGGRPRRIVGVVTMDQLMVDCGDDEIAIGDEAVIFGAQRTAHISVDDWAAALDTISYEVVCAISARVPRDYVGAV